MSVEYCHGCNQRWDSDDYEECPVCLDDEPAVAAGREVIAQLAEADGEIVFAGEVRAGCWDHRRDVSAAIARATGADQ